MSDHAQQGIANVERQVRQLRGYPRLVKMLKKFIAREEEFAKDTGMRLDDTISDAVKEAKLLLRELGE